METRRLPKVREHGDDIHDHHTTRARRGGHPGSQTVCSDEEFSMAFTEDSGIAGTTTYAWTVTDETLPVGVTVSEMSGTTDISVATINNVSGAPVTVTTR